MDRACCCSRRQPVFGGQLPTVAPVGEEVDPLLAAKVDADGASKGCCKCQRRSCCNKYCCCGCGCCWSILIVYILIGVYIYFVDTFKFQCAYLQNPSNPLRWPWFWPVSRLQSLGFGRTQDFFPTWQKYGDTFCASGQVWVSSYQNVSTALLAPQEREYWLGEHPLIGSHMPDAPHDGRTVFLLALGTGGLGKEPGTHNKFRKAFVDTLLPGDAKQKERMQDAVAQKLYDKLTQDYLTLSYEDFQGSTESGVYSFVSKYLHYVMFGILPDSPDHATMDEFYTGQLPLMYYLMPFGYLTEPFFKTQATIDKVIEIYLSTLPLQNFQEGRSEYAAMTKKELASLATSIMRIAGVVGAQAFVKIIMGFWGIPSQYPEKNSSFSFNGVLDTLDLSNSSELEAYMLEALRLNAPVSVTSRIATAPFTVDFDGGSYDFPKGTSVAIPLGLADVDPKKWGNDTYLFNMRRKGLKEGVLFFNTVGEAQTDRFCPGKPLTWAMGLEILRRLGQARRSKAVSK